MPSGSPQTRKPANPQTRKPANPQTRKPANPQTRKPANPQTRKPANPQTRKPANPQTRKPFLGNLANGSFKLRNIILCLFCSSVQRSLSSHLRSFFLNLDESDHGQKVLRRPGCRHCSLDKAFYI